MTFYENYLKLCNSIGKSPSAVAIELNLGKPSVTRWKHGAVPRDSTVSKIANYFHVAVADLIGDGCAEKETAAPKDDGLNYTDSELLQAYHVADARTKEAIRTLLGIKGE